MPDEFSGPERRSSHDRRLLHEINNKLTIVGFVDLVLMDPQYQGPEHQRLRDDLSNASKAAKSIADYVRILQGYHQARDEGVNLIDASALGLEEVFYNIVHVDDEKGVRDAFISALEQTSNVREAILRATPELKGIFGHDGKRVKYKVHSYGSVDEALEQMPREQVDLLVTDKDMPGRDGFSLLDTITQPEDRTLVRPQYRFIRNTAMMTGGVAPEETARVKSYGIETLIKPFSIPILEQRIYNLINRPATQSQS